MTVTTAKKVSMFESLEDFVRFAAQQVSKPEEDVRAYLRKRFTNYSPSNTGRYLTALRSWANVDVVPDSPPPPSQTCPICGEPVYGVSVRTYGKAAQHMWTCKEGKMAHYWQYRAEDTVNRLKQGNSGVYPEMNGGEE